MGALAALLAILLAAAQEPDRSELRFHRVHLKNGNFIDGALVKQTDKEITLKMKFGEMTVRLDQVQRVEFVKMRSTNEAPREEPLRKPPAPDRRDPFEGPAARPRTPQALFAASPSTRSRVDALLTELGRADVDQRPSVESRLCEAGDEAAPYLASLLEHLGAEAFASVGAVLARLKDRRCLPVLLQQLTSPIPAVRSLAASLIGAGGAPEAAGDLLPLLRDERPQVRAAAVTALQRLGHPALFDSLSPLVADPDREARTRALGALLELARKDRREALLAARLSDALGQAGGATRVDLLGALGRTGQIDRTPLLIPYLSDGGPDLRRAAHDALRRLTGQALGPEPEAWLAWWRNGARP